jgi:hypothetical protein
MSQIPEFTPTYVLMIVCNNGGQEGTHFSTVDQPQINAMDYISQKVKHE